MKLVGAGPRRDVEQSSTDGPELRRKIAGLDGGLLHRIHANARSRLHRVDPVGRVHAVNLGSLRAVGRAVHANAKDETRRGHGCSGDQLNLGLIEPQALA